MNKFEWFELLLELPSAERESQLDALALSDAPLALDLRRLLEKDVALADQADSDFSQQALAASPIVYSQLAQELPQFEILGLLGEGGMGEVWRVQRNVAGKAQVLALKLLRADQRDPDAMARFLREQQILLQLDHGNIARLYDAGKSASGKPWLAMELIEGQKITAHCDGLKLDIRQRLLVFKQALQAVQFAHERFIVHRDIKPDNVMVNTAGQVKLLDFGIAKSMTSLAVQRTTQRYFSAYSVSPEQLSGGVISVMTDVYAMGTLLYELLCGAEVIPDDLSISELQEQVLHQVPKPPSARLVATSAECRGLKPTAGAFGLSAELDKIVLHALKKLPQERYHSAAEFEADIDAYLEGMPIRAVGNTRFYIFKKFVRRHWLPVGAAAIGLVLLSGMTALLAWRGEQLKLANDEANLQRRATEAVNSFLIDAFKRADPLATAGGDRSLATLIDATFAEFKANQELDAVHTPILLALAEGLISLGKAAQAKSMLNDLNAQSNLSAAQAIELKILLARAAQTEFGAIELDKALEPLRGIDPNVFDSKQKERLALLEAQLAQMRGNPEIALSLISSNSPSALRLKVAALVALDRFDDAEIVVNQWQKITRASSLDRPLIAAARAQVADRQRQREKALGYARDALAEAIAVYGEQHSSVTGYRNNLASAQLRAGYFEQAQVGYQSLLTELIKTLEPGAPRIRFVRYNIALCNAKLGRLTPDDLAILRPAAEKIEIAYGFESFVALARAEMLTGQTKAFQARIALINARPDLTFKNDDLAFLKIAATTRSKAQLLKALATIPFSDPVLNAFVANY